MPPWVTTLRYCQHWEAVYSPATAHSNKAQISLPSMASCRRARRSFGTTEAEDWLAEAGASWSRRHSPPRGGVALGTDLPRLIDYLPPLRWIRGHEEKLPCLGVSRWGMKVLVGCQRFTFYGNWVFLLCGNPDRFRFLDAIRCWM